MVNHFKVLPGFIGSLAYKEAIPGDIMESKHLKEVKEKLQYLWERQNGECFRGFIAINLIIMADLISISIL